MLKISTHIQTVLILFLCSTATVAVAVACKIALTNNSDIPINLSLLPGTLFGYAIALATQTKKQS